jgi:hypothetical protein
MTIAGIYQMENKNSIEMSGYPDDIVRHLRESFDDQEAIRFHHEKDQVSLSISDNDVGLRRSLVETASESVGIVLSSRKKISIY